MIAKLQSNKPAGSHKPFRAENIKNDVNKNDRETWTYEDWQRNDMPGLNEMITGNPEKFQKLYNQRKSKKQ